MADHKRIWFSFLPIDYIGVEQYLNGYVARGWELLERSDCRTLTLVLQKTKRADLRYSVSCDSLVRVQELREVVAQKETAGWKPIATINHFDFYESMPCREVVLQPRQRKTPLIARSVRSLLLLLLFSAFFILIGLSQKIQVFNLWYLSNLGIFLHYAMPFFLLLAGYYLLWIILSFIVLRQNRPPKRFWMVFRGLLPILSVIWILLLSVALIFDLVQSLPYCLFLLFVLMAGSIFCYLCFRYNQPGKLFSAVSLVLALVFAGVLILHQVLPTNDKMKIGECEWRNTLSEVVHAENLGLHPHFIEAVSYAKKSSLFETQTHYWEGWKDCSLSSTVYRCHTAGVLQLILNDLLQEKNWKVVSNVFDSCWSTETRDRYEFLCCKENIIILLSCDQDLQPHLADFSMKFQ